jgi:CRISPR-associated protein Cmr4
MNPQLIFIHALSPLHAGTGQGIGVIDLPIAREKATGLPFLPGSSLKGAMRSLCRSEICSKLFGAAVTGAADEYAASTVQFSDQHLLLLPIRSLAGTFAWVTCPYVLRRLARDIEDAQIALPPASIPTITDIQQCLISDESASKIVFKNNAMVYLEDLDLKAQSNPDIAKWANWISSRVFIDTAWRQMLIERICVVHDDVFTFLTDTATEITARIKLREDSKTVQDGGLWYEEALPTETILSGIVIFQPTQKAGIDATEAYREIQALTQKVIQFGGKATVGRGLCHVQMTQKGL